MKSIKAICLTAVALALTHPVLAADEKDKVSLVQKWQPDTTYVLTIQNQMTNRATIDGEAKPEQKIDMQMGMEIAVGKKQANGEMPATIRYTFMKQKVTAGENVIAYDSQAPAQDQNQEMAKAIKPLLDAKLSATIGTDGKFKDLKGLTALWDKMAEEDPQAAGMAAAMKQSLNDEAITKMINQQASILPQKPVGVGDSYEGKYTMQVPLLGEMNIEYQGKVKDIQKKDGDTIITLDCTSSLVKKEPTSVPANVGFERINSVNIEQKGQMKFSLLHGQFMEMDTQQTMNMSLVGKNEQKVELSQQGNVLAKLEIKAAAQ